MRYKILGAIVCIIAIFTSVIAIAFDKEKSTRYHQHQENSAYETCRSHDDTKFCTHLPLVLIDTSGKEIPGSPITPENGNLDEATYTTAEDGSSTIRAEIKVINNDGKNNHLDDKAELESLIDIRIRGNSSRFFDKKSYLVNAVDESGQSKDVSMIGMDKFDQWALHGPYLDKTLIRNYMWYNIAGEIMDYSPNVRFCEVFINGEYRGLYVMTETIGSKKDARLKLTEPLKNSPYTSYCIRLDRGSANPLKNIQTFTQYAYRNLQSVDIVYPGTKNLTEERAKWIAQDFSDFEKALYSYDYDTENYGFWNYTDVDSFAEYFIINEFTCNYDAGWLSTYAYKDIRGKIKLCIWDFNSACDNYTQSLTDPQHMELQNNVWYYMMTKDEYFIDKVISKYKKLRQGVLSEKYLDNYIDDVVKWLGPAVERNFELWGYTFGIDMLVPSERNPENFDDAVYDMKTFIHNRGDWLDDNIEILKQYCHESKIKKFNH